MATKTLTFKRTINAPAEQVYRAFTNSQALREWLCDTAFVQPREGGRLVCAWNTGDALMGKYTSLVANKKIAFTLRSDSSDTDRSQATVTISGKGESSIVTLIDTGDGKDWLKLSKEIEKGWNDSLDNLKSVLETGIDQRLANRPLMGVHIAESKLGDAGVRLGGVSEGLGAQAAGLQKGDVIISIAGKKTPDWNSFSVPLSEHRAGDKVKVVFNRNGRKNTVTMTLSPRPMPEVPATAEALAENIAKAYTGVNRDLTQALKGMSDERASRRPAPGEWSVKHTLAHLIASERDRHHWITCVFAGQEQWQDDGEGNLQIRLDAVINAYPTVQALLQEFKRNAAETVALLASLPEDFVAKNKGSYYRIAREMADWVDHMNEHVEQIRAATTK